MSRAEEFELLNAPRYLLRVYFSTNFHALETIGILSLVSSLFSPAKLDLFGSRTVEERHRVSTGDEVNLRARGRPVSRGGERAFSRRSPSHFIKRNSATAAEGGGTAVGSGAGRGTTEKPKERAANKTRCESHLLFSRSIVVCVQLGLSRTVWMCECLRQRHRAT